MDETGMFTIKKVGGKDHMEAIIDACLPTCSQFYIGAYSKNLFLHYIGANIHEKLRNFDESNGYYYLFHYRSAHASFDEASFVVHYKHLDQFRNQNFSWNFHNNNATIYVLLQVSTPFNVLDNPPAPLQVNITPRPRYFIEFAGWDAFNQNSFDEFFNRVAGTFNQHKVYPILLSTFRSKHLTNVLDRRNLRIVEFTQINQEDMQNVRASLQQNGIQLPTTNKRYFILILWRQ